MTKKHFQALADALRSSRPPAGRDTRDIDAQWTKTVAAVANACSRFNPNFDRARFITATEE